MASQTRDYLGNKRPTHSDSSTGLSSCQRQQSTRDWCERTTILPTTSIPLFTDAHCRIDPMTQMTPEIWMVFLRPRMSANFPTARAPNKEPAGIAAMRSLSGMVFNVSKKTYQRCHLVHWTQARDDSWRGKK